MPLRRDTRWYLTWRARLPAPLRRLEAAAEGALVARPWLHDRVMWLGGTVGALCCNSM